LNVLPVDSPLRGNPVFWLMWLLLGSTVVAGFVTLAIALRSADRELPSSYHWEGERLDRDFALARNAARHGVEVTFVATAGQCSATVRGAPNEPAALHLLFVNSTDAALDHAVRLTRVAPATYAADCAVLPSGRWRVALQDDAGQWAIRTQFIGDVSRLELRARNPDGAP